VWVAVTGVAGAVAAVLALNSHVPNRVQPPVRSQVVKASTPPTPAPAAQSEEGQPIAPASVFDPAIFVAAPPPGPGVGAAFSVSDKGVWLTARHVVEGCDRVVIVTAPGQGVSAEAKILPGKETALLLTRGGAPALPIAPAQLLRRGQHAWHPGFPKGQPGEAASELVRRANLWVGWRGLRAQPVLVFRETARWPAVRGSLAGLSGAPVLDGAGRVIGVTVAENPRHRRLYTTTPASLHAVLTEAAVEADGAGGAPMNSATWKSNSDELRTSLSVAEVECLAR
jgi:S1-C subfamily serine protease